MSVYKARLIACSTKRTRHLAHPHHRTGSLCSHMRLDHLHSRSLWCGEGSQRCFCYVAADKQALSSPVRACFGCSLRKSSSSLRPAARMLMRLPWSDSYCDQFHPEGHLHTLRFLESSHSDPHPHRSEASVIHSAVPMTSRRCFLPGYVRSVAVTQSEYSGLRARPSMGDDRPRPGTDGYTTAVHPCRCCEQIKDKRLVSTSSPYRVTSRLTCCIACGHSSVPSRIPST